MNSLEQVKQYFYTTVEEHCYGIMKQDAMLHTYGVYHISLLLGKLRNLDLELLGCMALLHDISKYIHHTSFNHASTSALLAQKFLEENKLYDPTQIHQIVTSISVHSDKDYIHDDYSECLKDADIYQAYLDDPTRIFANYELKRINKINHELK